MYSSKWIVLVSSFIAEEMPMSSKKTKQCRRNAAKCCGIFVIPKLHCKEYLSNARYSVHHCSVCQHGYHGARAF